MNVDSTIAATSAGSDFIKQYINPCDHGTAKCVGIPDGNTMMTYTIDLKFNKTLDANFFISQEYITAGGTVPPSLNYTIICTPWAHVPYVVVGTYYFTDSNKKPTSQKRYVGIVDPNWNQSDRDFAYGRCVYKGTTLYWIGNEYQRQGIIYATQAPAMRNPKAIGSMSDAKLDSILFNMFDDSDDITSYSRRYETFTIDQGCYMPQRWNFGTCNYFNTPLLGDSLNVDYRMQVYNSGVFSTVSICTEDSRFNATTNPLYLSMSSLNLAENTCELLTSMNCGYISINGADVNNSFSLKSCSGYELIPFMDSEYFGLLQNPPMLDTAAMFAVAQMNAGLLYAYPSSYNDFNTMWKNVVSWYNNFRRWYKSDTVQTIGSAIGAVVPGVSTAMNILNKLT